MIRTRAARLVPLLVLVGCSTHHGYSRISSGNAFIEQWDGGPVSVACYRNGEILGAEAVDADFPLRGWVDGEAVDHPSIPRWRDQLAALTALAGAPDTRGVDLVRAAAGFPFDEAVAECCSLWVGSSHDRAADLLDCADDLDVGDAFAERLARTALGGDPTDDRTSQWVRALTGADHDEAVLALVTSSRAGPRTADVALGLLDDHAARHRRTIFDAAARRLAADPAAAYCIVEAAEELPNADETAALAALLDGDVPTELARQILRQLDDRPTRARAFLFARAADRCYRDARSHFAIAQALEQLPTLPRLDAARAVVARPDAPEALVVLLVDAVDELRSTDREEFLLLVLDGPHGGIPAVRNACADAARRHLPSRARERVLDRVGRGRG
jgi:hypothetical protein